VRQAALKKANMSDTSRYYDRQFKIGDEAKMCLNSYLQGLDMFQSKQIFMRIQMNGPIKEHVEEFANLYNRGINEISSYLEEFK
jgi:hypothetical protein